MALLSVALNTARTLMNDDVGAVWTDAALIPKAQEAHRMLQVRLWKAGSPVVRAQSAAIDVAINAVTITPPADMLTPFRLFEYASTVETYADSTEITEQNFLPRQAPTAKIGFWSWKGEVIEIMPPTAARKVVMHYRKSITLPAAATDPIGIIFGELFLGPQVAAMCHGSVGNKDAFEAMMGIATANFADVIEANRGKQSPSEKP
jgi:hypothetical protein